MIRLNKKKPSKQQALDAVKTLISYAGDDPNRKSLIKTPTRVIDSFLEHFSGYDQEPEKILNCHFDDTNNYQQIIILKNIEFTSICEHHLAPIIGYATIAYLPRTKVVGISKLARIVDVYAKRLQIQERLTQDIGRSIDKYLKPKACGVYIESEHLCLATRGAKKKGAKLITSYITPKINSKLSLEISQAINN